MGKKKTKTITHTATNTIMTKLNTANLLEEYLPKVVTTPWYKKNRSVAEIVEYVGQMSKARASLWEEIYVKFPDARGHDVTVTSTGLVIINPNEE